MGRDAKWGKKPSSWANGGLLSGAASGYYGCSKVGANKLDGAETRLGTPANRRHDSLHVQLTQLLSTEIDMLFGGGLLGTILLIAIIVYFVRRT
jgi:hypothetical protein